MPGYIIHLAEGQCVLNKLCELNKDYAKDPLWRKQFLIGTLLPDVAKGEQKKRSHFRNPEDDMSVIAAPDLSRYLQEHPFDISNPISCGYFVHLHLDYRYYTEFLPKCVSFQNQDDKEERRLDQIRTVVLKNTGEEITVEDFFSGTYLYGDYTKLNGRIMERFNLILPDQNDVPQGSYCGLKLSDIADLIDELRCYLQEQVFETQEVKVIPPDKLNDFLLESAAEFVHTFKKEVKIW